MTYEYQFIPVNDGNGDSLRVHGKNGWRVVPGILYGTRMGDVVLMEREIAPTIPTYEIVNGSELQEGDRCLIEVRVTEINTHVHVRARDIESPWNADTRLWTWHGEHGSGVGNKDIRRIKR